MVSLLLLFLFFVFFCGKSNSTLLDMLASPMSRIMTIIMPVISTGGYKSGGGQGEHEGRCVSTNGFNDLVGTRTR